MLRFLIVLHIATSIRSTVEPKEKLDVSDAHWVLISSPFFGHIIPLLDLSKVLSSHQSVTFVTSASKIQVLKQRGGIVRWER